MKIEKPVPPANPGELLTPMSGKLRLYDSQTPNHFAWNPAVAPSVHVARKVKNI
jgi:hypothetical protein